MEITKEIAEKVLNIVDAGLSWGLGRPVAGQMCVEAAVCYALGLPHSDDPKCVSAALREFKIRLNDSLWSSPAARAKGMRRLAVAQLGSLGVLDDRDFVKGLASLAADWAEKANPKSPDEAASADAYALASEAAAAANSAAYAANSAAYAAYAAAYAAYAANSAAYAANSAAYAAYAARDIFLADCAEDVVKLLIQLKAPGCQWLYLTEAQK